MGLASTTVVPGKEGRVEAMTFSRDPDLNLNLSPGIGDLYVSLGTLIERGIGTGISCPSKVTSIVSPPPLPAGTVATYSRTVGSNLGGRTTPGRGGAYAPLSLPLDEYLE